MCMRMLGTGFRCDAVDDYNCGRDLMLMGTVVEITSMVMMVVTTISAGDAAGDVRGKLSMTHTLATPG